jgi:hypothetical protein
MMQTANGALPIIFTIILIHSISYIKPEKPERKKQERTRKNILLVVLSEIFFLAIFGAIIEGIGANLNKLTTSHIVYGYVHL